MLEILTSGDLAPEVGKLGKNAKFEHSLLTVMHCM